MDFVMETGSRIHRRSDRAGNNVYKGHKCPHPLSLRLSTIRQLLSVLREFPRRGEVDAASRASAVIGERKGHGDG